MEAIQQFLAVAASTILFLGTDHPRLIALSSFVAVILIVALQVYVPHDTGLFPASTVFGNFVLGIPLTCAILCLVVYYAVRQAARAEATAEREFERSEALLGNILPASIAVRLKDRGHAQLLKSIDILIGDDATHKHKHIVYFVLLQEIHHTGNDGVVRARQNG